MKPPTVFVSYCHSNSQWRDRLRIHLKGFEKQGAFTVWDDHAIDPAMNWREEINRSMDDARVAVLLVSADFLASDFVNDEELPRLRERQEKDGLAIMPVIVEPCAWSEFDKVSANQVFPRGGKALSTGSETWIQEQLAETARAVKKAVDARWSTSALGIIRRHALVGNAIVAFLAVAAALLCLDVFSRDTFGSLVGHPEREQLEQIIKSLWAILLLAVVLYHANLWWIDILGKKLANIRAGATVLERAREALGGPVRLYLVPSTAILAAIVKLVTVISRNAGQPGVGPKRLFFWFQVVFALAVVVQSAFCYRFLRRRP